ncbi:MAG: phosphoglycerate dehydrogenase, partial [Pseudomonadales bacterium]|nr:phosphoglycerate dehydrogenase [Pseudomonadales bacterium]
RIKILLLEGVHQSAVEAFEREGYTQIEYHSAALSEDELKAHISDAHIVGIRSRTQLTADVIAAANRLIAIGCFCIGTNQVSLSAALRQGVAVFNAPFSNTRSVAELVIAEAILLLRGVPEKNALAHRGGWQKSAKDSYEIRGKTLGIIGYGNIGSQVSVLAESIGMRVQFHDTVSKLPLGNATQTHSLDELLATSDVITLHVPEDGSTINMMGKAQFDQMKDGAVFINASRGTVVDIDALADALQSRKLLGAAIDVFPAEPKSAQEEFLSPLRQFDNCILTPHIGGSTMEAQEKIGLEVASKLIKFSDNGSTLSSVNFPEVALPSHPGSHRILHVHNNVPGILSQINQFFSENSINIRSQYLQTVQDVGYVVTDIDEEYSSLALAKLQEIEGTIRTRILF